MKLHDAIDLYCERLGPGLLAEPLNLFSNLSFLIAAVLATRIYLRERSSWNGALVVFSLYTVAAGSALFHSFATGWAQLCDVIPIGLMMLYFLAAILRGPLGMNAGGVLAGFVLLGVLTTLGVLLPAEWFNHSNEYFGGLSMLLVVGFAARRRAPDDSRALLQCAAVFSLSLVFRSVDLWLCPYWPHGTHFLWHISNGVMLYLLSRRVLTYS